jgi:UDP-N-acetylglucosamine 2-epimerase
MMSPKPNINLNIGSGTHVKITGRMIEKIEEVILDKKLFFLYTEIQIQLWGETVETGLNKLAGASLQKILEAFEIVVSTSNKSYDLVYWKGKAEQEILNILDH